MLTEIMKNVQMKEASLEKIWFLQKNRWKEHSGLFLWNCDDDILFFGYLLYY